MAPETIKAQPAQRVAYGEAAALTGRFGLATGDFGQYVRAPAGKAGDVITFVDEVIGPQLLRFAKEGVADEGQ
jgi:hypothetical protein